MKEPDAGKPNFLRAGWIIIPLALILCAYNDSLILDPALLPKFLTVSLFLIVFGIFLLFKKNSISSSGKAANNGITVGIFIYVLAGAISLIYSSNPADGFFDWLKIIVLLTFTYFIIYYFHSDTDYLQKLTISISAFALLAGLTGIYQLIDIAISGNVNHQSTYLVKSTFANRNLFSEVLLLTLPFSFYGIISLKGVLRYLSGLSAAASCVLIVGLLVREVWVATFISAIASLLIFSIINIRNFRKAFASIPRKLIWIFAGSISALVVVIILLYGRSGSIEQFKKQTSFISNPHYGSSKDRFDLWERSFKIIKAHPIQGTGLGTWKIQQLQYNEKGTLAEDAVTFYQSPHNDFIWVASEMGIVGLTCYLFIFAAAFYYLVILLKRLKGKPESVFYYFIFFGLVSYFVISNFGFPRERIEQQVLLAFILSSIVIGYYLHIKENPEIIPSKVRIVSGKIVLICLNLLLIVALVFGTFRLVSESHIRKAFEARETGDQKTVIAQMADAETFARHIDPLSTPLSWYSGSAYFVLGDNGNALSEFEKAYAINPYHIHVLNNYGSALELHGRHQEAIYKYKQALKINPDFDDALINLSAAYFNIGQIDSAFFALRKVNSQSHDPRYQQFIDVEVPAVLSIILTRTSEDFLKNYIVQIRNVPKWRTDIFFKAKKNNVSLQYQCILDIFYVMEKSKTLPGRDEIDAIKAKYKNALL